MQSRFDANAITAQLTELMFCTDTRGRHLICHEDGTFKEGVVKDISNHYDGRLKLHLFDGRYCTWRLPQTVIETVGKTLKMQGWNHV